jgi:hypothetical protein
MKMFVWVCVDGGDDGYSPLGVFELELESDGLEEDDRLDEDDDDDDVSETGGQVEKPGDQTTYGLAGGPAGGLAGAEQRLAGLAHTGWRNGGRSWALETTLVLV